MIILNFAHPLTPAQLAQIATQTDSDPEVRTIPVQIDHGQPLTPQIVALVDAADLTPEQWQTMPLLVNLPGLTPAAAGILAELHGRMGYFPSVLALKRGDGIVPPRFDVWEIADLQALRSAARGRR